MTIDLELQRASSCASIPSDEKFLLWAESALTGRGPQQLTIRIVDRQEIEDLNFRFRAREGATNVLSFPADLPAEVNLPLLGDIVICAPLVESEAEEQAKLPEAHWAHLVIHGVLHLLGMDHENEADAEKMEAMEKTLLGRLGFPDPYE